MTRRSITCLLPNPRYYKYLSIAWGMIILILCLMPSNDLPKADNIPHLDKIVHFSLYFIWAVLLLSTSDRYSWNLRPFILILLMLLFSFFIEILQLILPLGRSFSLLDLTANFAGLAAGWIFTLKLK